MRFPSINSNYPKVQEVLEFYELMDSSINNRFKAAKLNLANGAGIVDPELIGKTWEDIDGYFKVLHDEADKQASMFLIASAEAVIRIDFLNRVRNRLKDKVSLTFRKIEKKRRNQKSRNVRLDDDILDTWANNVLSAKKLVGDFKGALKFRHWLAHGRWWRPKLGQKYDPAGIYKLIVDIFEKLPLSN